MSTTTSIATRLTIPELVREFDLAMHEIKQGLDLLKGAEERLRCFSTCGTAYDLCLFRQNEHSLDFERKRVRLRGAAWRYLVSRAEIKKLASLKRCKEIDEMLAKPETLPDITVENLMGWVESLDQLATDFLKEAAVEVFEWLRPPNRRFRTNDPFKVGKRVVLSWGIVRPCYSGRGTMQVNYHHEDRLRSLDNVFHLLDGQGVSPTPRGELVDAIDGCLAGEFYETKYFRFRAFRNGNLHVEFLRPDLVRKLNEIGGKGLPVPDERGEG